MSFNIELLFGKDEIRKYHSGVELSLPEKKINLQNFLFDYSVEVNAFLKGVDTAVGWTEYFMIDCKEYGAENTLPITTREEFMEFFRNDDLLTLLTADDRLEIFSSILLGESDFTKELLDQILSDYGVGHLIIVDRNAKRKLHL